MVQNISASASVSVFAALIAPIQPSHLHSTCFNHASPHDSSAFHSPRASNLGAPSKSTIGPTASPDVWPLHLAALPIVAAAMHVLDFVDLRDYRARRYEQIHIAELDNSFFSGVSDGEPIAKGREGMTGDEIERICGHTWRRTGGRVAHDQRMSHRDYS
jgi:hypothetical protein